MIFFTGSGNVPNIGFPTASENDKCVERDGKRIIIASTHFILSELFAVSYWKVILKLTMIRDFCGTGSTSKIQNARYLIYFSPGNGCVRTTINDLLFWHGSLLFPKTLLVSDFSYLFLTLSSPNQKGLSQKRIWVGSCSDTSK